MPRLALRASGRVMAAAVALLLFQPADGDEAAIRRNLAVSVPDLPKIDQISPTAVPGIYELRMGSTLLYSDELGLHLFEGQLIDARRRINLTAERIALLRAVDFSALPLEDALMWKRGTGERKLVVFADPNCGYCKKFEKDLQSIENVTVYTFLYPILGGDSPEKSQAIWCAPDRVQAWRSWMLQAEIVTSAESCDASALQRNLALGQRYNVKGTPGLIFEDGRVVPGAADASEIERQLAQASQRASPSRQPAAAASGT